MMPQRVTLQRRRMEKILAELTLTFPSNRSARWENTRYPDMVATYRSLADVHIVPDQMTFANAVATILHEEENVDVLARACRTYPALVRQHHLELLLRELGGFSLVVYSITLDLEGIDLLIVDEGLAFGLRLSVETPGARFWKKIKEKRHPLPPGLPILDLDVTPDEYRVGPFWLHSPAQVATVRNFVEVYKAKRNAG